MKVNFFDTNNKTDNKSTIINQLLLDFRNEEDVFAGEDFINEDGNYEIQISIKGKNKSIQLDTEMFIDWIVGEFEHQAKREKELIKSVEIFRDSVSKVIIED